LALSFYLENDYIFPTSVNVLAILNNNPDKILKSEWNADENRWFTVSEKKGLPA
jgi:hypothetical protein